MSELEPTITELEPTATERPQALLDERWAESGYPHALRPELHKALMARGIDYWVAQGITFWNRDDGCECLAYGYKANGVPKLAIKVVGFTDPEQAIAATLGAKVTGETSDGFHTFNELYHHRAVLFSVIVRDHNELAWKSKLHYDGTMYDGMFIVGIETPHGQATYHYDIDPYWDMFDCRELGRAPEWDGHTPSDAIERIATLGLCNCSNNERTSDVDATGERQRVAGKVYLVEACDELIESWCPLGVYMSREAAGKHAESLRGEVDGVMSFARVVEMEVLG